MHQSGVYIPVSFEVQPCINWKYIPVSFDSAYLYQLTKRTCIIAATEPAATPAEVNPAPAKPAGAATPAAAPTPTAAITSEYKTLIHRDYKLILSSQLQ